MGRWTSSKLTSTYGLTAIHRTALAEVLTGIRTPPSSSQSVSWGYRSKHDPMAVVPNAIYRAIADHMGPISLDLLHSTVVSILPIQEGRTSVVVLCDYLRELNKQGIVTLVSKGTV